MTDEEKGRRKRDKVRRMMQRARKSFLWFSDPMDKLKNKVKRKKKNERTETKRNKDKK